MYSRPSPRQSRSNSDWKRGPRQNFQRGRRNFTGDKIDINRFISKARPAEIAAVFVPQNSFSTLAIHEALKRTIAQHQFKTLTPIQDQAIPEILAGHDVIGLANTGTGKTAAFLIPMINKILANPNEKVLIVAPTRELAIQIQEEFSLFARALRIFSVVVVGGANIRQQIMGLRTRHNVVIGTPGRLKDLINRRTLDLSGFSNVILDEADRMLDMGFINDVTLLLSLVAKKRQTLLFSATFSTEVDNLVKKFLTNPKKISHKTGETCSQVDQNIVRVGTGKDKVDVLHELLNQAQFEKVLVFTRTKHGADRLSKGLTIRGFKTDAIHGNKSQGKRQSALKMFKDGRVDILVATDVAARGLDIPNVSHVINFDVPATFEDYIHRIGRTGRAEKLGTALTFIG